MENEQTLLDSTASDTVVGATFLLASAALQEQMYKRSILKSRIP